MGLAATLLISLGLAMDCFAVSLGVGAGRNRVDSRTIFRISFHFGLFQGGMTLIGWLLGSTVVSLISGFDHWIAFALLGWVGVRMIIEGFRSDEINCEVCPPDPSRGGTLMMLCVATSLDAMAVGLSMAMLNVDIISSSLIIGAGSLLLSLIGILLGNRLSEAFGKRMEVVGGIILNLIGIRILISHLFS